MGLFPGIPKDFLEVSQGGIRIVRVLVAVADPLHNGAVNVVFGHPIRNPTWSYRFVAARR